MKDSILIADDDTDVVSALRYLLQTEGYEVSTATSPEEVIAATKHRSFDVLLMDMNYSRDTTSGQEGLTLIRRLREADCSSAIVVMTAWGSIETAVGALQAGASDFVQKPWENERLLSVLASQMRLVQVEQRARRLTQENQLLRQGMDSTGESSLFHQSPVMQQLMTKLTAVARSDATLLLTGENGTGKNFLVKHVHELSSRSARPLISVNMGAIAETLFESEMFGHVKGSFTDARETRIGRFELADGGTLFLDEIGNMTWSQQGKLLRVLEDRSFEKVGASRTQETDCRLICATNCDLEEAVQDGTFRKDLLYRINTVVIEVPPLRQRSEDIIGLAEHFLNTYRQRYHKPDLDFTAEASQALLSYSWPGNVRELAHVVERAIILSGDRIDRDALGLDLKRRDTAYDSTLTHDLTLEQIERQVMQERLTQHGDNVPVAAATLGLSKSAFYRHLKKHGLK